MAQLSSQTPPPAALSAVKAAPEPARGHPVVVLVSGAAHRDFQDRLAATLQAGGIATLDLEQSKGWSRGEIDEQVRGARLFACEIGAAPLRWPATRTPSAEILLFPKKVAERAHRPRLIVTSGRRVEPKHRVATDSWLTLPSAELTPEIEHQISEAVVLWVLARSGAGAQKSISSPPPPP